MWVKTKKNNQWIPVFHCYNRSTTVWKRRDCENPTNHKREDREAGVGAEQDETAAPQRREERWVQLPQETAVQRRRGQAAHGGDAPHHTLPQPRIFRPGWLGFLPPKSLGWRKRERRGVSRKRPPKMTLQDDFWDLQRAEGTLEAVDKTNFFQTQSLSRKRLVTAKQKISVQDTAVSKKGEDNTA